MEKIGRVLLSVLMAGAAVSLLGGAICDSGDDNSGPTGTDTTPPGAVIAFGALGGDAHVNLAWVNPLDADCAGTLVRFSTASAPTTPTSGQAVPNGANGMFAGGAGAAGSFNHTGLDNGVTYYYGAFAYDESGNYSAVTNASATPTATTTGDVTFTLVTQRPEVANAWPGPDGFIGTADDLVNANPSPMNQSEANTISSYSYNAFDFGSGATETGYLPEGYNAATFLDGTVTIDMDVAASGGGELVTDWDLSGTEPYTGHGDYWAVITAVNSGAYDAVTGVFTLNVDFTATLPGGTADALGFDIYGIAYVVEAADFVTGIGIPYVDDTAIPLAQALGATRVLVLWGSGIVPASTGGSGGTFPEMPVTSCIVAVTTD